MFKLLNTTIKWNIQNQVFKTRLKFNKTFRCMKYYIYPYPRHTLYHNPKILDTLYHMILYQKTLKLLIHL